jgi:Spy/CpxP family protein refolding chaperone
MRRSNFTTLLYLLLVLLSGAVLGVFANRVYMVKADAATPGPGRGPRNHAEFRKHYLDEMRSRLHLTDAQAGQLQQIMDATDQQFRQMRKSIDADHQQRVMAMLDDTQKTEYTKMIAEREKHRQQHDKKGF